MPHCTTVAPHATHYSIATSVGMCRPITCVIVPDDHTTIAVDKAQLSNLCQKSKHSNTKLFICFESLCM